MHGESDAVQIRAVVGDDRKGEHDEAELAKTAKVREEDRCEEPTAARGIVAILVDVVAAIDRGSRHDGHAEHLRKEQGEDQTGPGRQKDLRARLIGWLINSVVCSVRCPASRETVHDGTERQDRAHLRRADAHWDILEVASVCEDAEDDQEDDEGRDPTPEFVRMHDLVAEERDQECANGDDDDSDRTDDVVVHGIDELSSDDAVDARPADASEDVEYCNQFDSPPAEPEARKNHLTKAKSWSEGREVADGEDTNQVEEEDNQDGIHESKEEESLSQKTDGEGGDDHVGGEPLY